MEKDNEKIGTFINDINRGIRIPYEQFIADLEAAEKEAAEKSSEKPLEQDK